MPDLSDEIETAATSPAAASGDGQSVTARPIADMIAAEKHLDQKTALAEVGEYGGPGSLWKRLRPARFVPPGAQ